MRKGSYVKITISVIAIVCNVVLFGWLIFEMFRNPPAGSNVIVPVVMGLFFLLNVVAITLTSGAYKGLQASFSSLSRSSKVRLIGLGIVLLGCISLGFWVGFSSHDRILTWKRERAEQAKFEKFMGKKAPDVIARTLDGSEWKLEDQCGKVVVIDFWATWCGPCVGAMPRMKEIYEKYKSRDDFVMVGVSLDHDKQALMKFCQEHEISWPQIFEADKGWDNSVAKSFEIRGIPSVWVIDKGGKVVGMGLRGERVGLTVGKTLNEAQAVPDL